MCAVIRSPRSVRAQAYLEQAAAARDLMAGETDPKMASALQRIAERYEELAAKAKGRPVLVW